MALAQRRVARGFHVVWAISADDDDQPHVGAARSRRPAFSSSISTGRADRVELRSAPCGLREENVFGWPITALVLALALALPLFDRALPRRSRYPWIAAIAIGVVLSLLRTVRTEPSVVMVGVAVVFLTLPRARMKERLALVACALGVYLGVGFAARKALAAQFEHAVEVVAAAGGTPYEGPYQDFHELWHPVFCGLGDFDTKYGYAWDDRVAYAYSLPYLEAIAGRPLHVNTQNWAQDESYDLEGRYPVAFFDRAGYHEIVRAKVLADIGHDPLWYGTILVKRVGRILAWTSPVGLAAGRFQVSYDSPVWGIGAGILFVLLAIRRRWFEVKLLLFTASLSIIPFVIYSGGGTTNYSCFHLAAVALVAAFVLPRFARLAKLVAGRVLR